MLIYPATPLPSWTYPASEGFKTLISDFDSGIEVRRKLLRFSKRSFNLNYKNLLLTDRNTLHDFYRNVGGMSDSFWFVDWVSKKWIDEFVGRGVLYPLTGAVANDGGVQTDETDHANDATASDMTLLPPVPEVNDAYYFIGTTPFDVLRIQIGIPGVGTWTIVWEYWKGSWSALSGVTDGTSAFKAAAGAHDVLWTKPTDEVATTIAGIAGYAIRARVSAYTSVTTQPKGSQAWKGTRYYDLHSLTTNPYVIYVDGVAKTGGGTDYTFISGGGDAGADRIRFTAMQTIGSLITSDLTGFLRIKGRMGDDTFPEEMVAPTNGGVFNIQLKVAEVQW